MGSGHETTNRSVGRAHGCMTYAISLGCSVSRLLTRHNQGIAQWSPDPFPRERVGSGHETIGPLTSLSCPPSRPPTSLT